MPHHRALRPLDEGLVVLVRVQASKVAPWPAACEHHPGIPAVVTQRLVDAHAVGMSRCDALSVSKPSNSRCISLWISTLRDERTVLAGLPTL